MSRYLAILFILIVGGSNAFGQETDSVETKSPGKALLFSIIPGGGQVYNESPIKAVLFAGAFTYFAYEYLRIDGIYQDDPTDQELHRSRNDQVWLMALTWVLNVGDAYVEAQLWDFESYEVDDAVLQDTELKQTEETDIKDGTE
ncbi:MAG: hypothetical protein K9M49_10420 [Candidatus Marinimicrobia bacterium]|nr:hypothetical protein [Candidatus Neomarinimicrobiota bacterium]MCF7850973.1 hypothetical protein [Candidatus Neomarinimicrobiota bacterium]MCF7905550.1 hypothetical protein [Candidatus Neomarinimicrobiota bacterium]